jgi:hypothetical protein
MNIGYYKKINIHIIQYTDYLFTFTNIVYLYEEIGSLTYNKTKNGSYKSIKIAFISIDYQCQK